MAVSSEAIEAKLVVDLEKESSSEKRLRVSTTSSGVTGAEATLRSSQFSSLSSLITLPIDSFLNPPPPMILGANSTFLSML